MLHTVRWSSPYRERIVSCEERSVQAGARIRFQEPESPKPMSCSRQVESWGPGKARGSVQNAALSSLSYLVGACHVLHDPKDSRI